MVQFLPGSLLKINTFENKLSSQDVSGPLSGASSFSEALSCVNCAAWYSGVKWSEDNAFTEACGRDSLKFEKGVGLDEINICQCPDRGFWIFAWMVSYTCINRNMNMITFMFLSFQEASTLPMKTSQKERAPSNVT